MNGFLVGPSYIVRRPCVTIAVQIRVAPVLERIVELETNTTVRRCQVRDGRDECGRRFALANFGRRQVRLRSRRANR